jgi:hypothetical protein
MCNYYRFKSILDNINISKVFNTKLGPRNVACYEYGQEKDIQFVYYDYDNTILFILDINKEGNIIKYFSRKNIDDIAIFSAVYEIETLLYNEDINKKEDILNLLFDNISYNFNSTTYR